MKDYSAMTEEELREEIAKQYGEDWNVYQLDPDSELAKEFEKRITTGV